MFSPFFNCYKLSVITLKRLKSNNEEKRMDPLTLIPSYTGIPVLSHLELSFTFF
jgi:hypothetical protein